MTVEAVATRTTPTTSQQPRVQADPAPAPAPSAHRWLLPLVLLLVAAANLQVLRWGFLSDDWTLLHHMQVSGAFRLYVLPFSTPLYRPVSWGGIALMHSAFGLHPLPYHVVALGFIVGAAATMYFVALRVGLRQPASAIAALAFGAHPAVAWGDSWIACMGSPMGDFFAAQALLRLLHRAPTRRQQAVGLVFTVLAIGSHETFTALPAVVFILRLGFTHRADSLWSRLATGLRGSLPVWLAAVAVFGAQEATRAPAPIVEYQDNLVGLNVPEHMGRLLQELLGVTLVSPGTVNTHRSELFAVLIWMLLLACGLAAFRMGHRLGLLGFIACVPALYPIAILVTHTMDPYYLEVALLPFALAIGSIGETLVEGLPRCARVRLLVPLLVVGAALGGFVMIRNMDEGALGFVRARQAVLLAEVRAKYPGPLPPVIDLTHSGPYDSLVTYKGYMFNVIYNDPGLIVRLDQ